MDEILYNLRLITDARNQLLKDTADIFDYSSRGDKIDELTSSISSCVLALLLLARRSGIELSQIKEELFKRINTGIIDGSMYEGRFNDLSVILKFIRSD